MAPAGAANGWSANVEPELAGLSRAQRRSLAQHWTEAGRAEHASIAAFSRFALQLMALGAPADLVAEATRAMADEIKHTRLCLGVASAAAGQEVGLGPIDIGGSMDGEVIPATVLVDTIREGCINETICAAQAQAAFGDSVDGEIRAALEGIAADEQRHSALAWRTVKWILSEHPHLNPLAQASFSEHIAAWSDSAVKEEEHALSAFGLQGASADARTARRVIRQVIRPCVSALFGDTLDTEIKHQMRT